MISCPHCDRKFREANDVYNHIKMKHGGPAKARRFRRENMPEREPSIAEDLTDAMLAAACGEDVPEHIAMMFPDEIDDIRRQREEGAR